VRLSLDLPSGSRRADRFGHLPAGQVIDIGRDGSQFSVIQRGLPRGHGGLADSLGHHRQDLLGAVTVLPAGVGQVAHGRTGEAPGNRPITPSRCAVTAHTARLEDGVSLREERIAGDCCRRRTDLADQEPPRQRPAADQGQHPEEDPTRGHRVDPQGRFPPFVVFRHGMDLREPVRATDATFAFVPPAELSQTLIISPSYASGSRLAIPAIDPGKGPFLTESLVVQSAHPPNFSADRPTGRSPYSKVALDRMLPLEYSQ
jgi:hypothetical protein